ncbi:EscU/YscU/HrcU family type III secretion system export apparatus switch protein [Rhodomicrobium vannielii]|uniref:EscU/YscU/HrcU family type III secretion system export apparatus switch protein n=1 Tax=Rhodomicrobium vannielii TaxID=1069 RepID=UPI001FDA7450|nr:EscU/YscU/HrcU family type III secretion system export apparatus switch protein [Rhodomicrobium vannielii]
MGLLADNSETDNKTEAPSEKRLRDSLDKDGGPSSREVNSAAALFALVLFLMTMAPADFGEVVKNLSVFIEDPSGFSLENGADAFFILQLAGLTIFNFALPLVLMLLAATLLASFAQNPPTLIFNKIAPDLARISPQAGLKRLFAFDAVVDLLKSFIKFGIVAIAFYVAFQGGAAALLVLQTDSASTIELIKRLAFKAILICALACAVLAVADVFWTRFRWLRKLKMSRQDLKDEHKQSEGDPMLRARARAIARARVRRNMMTSVPNATVVIANPTHYAVALRYVRGQDRAPQTLAKGKNKLALRIRSIAEDNNVPVVENKALAKSLHDAVRVDQPIPHEFYKAVAEVIIYINKKGG